MSCFLFSLFSSTKLEEEGETSPAQGEGLAPVGLGEVLGKAGRRVQKNVFTCMYMEKMIAIKSTPGIGGGGDEGEW
jgi:hypothetical protein